MLNSWTIRNFKAFKDEQHFELSGINVFTGANSSGKSTIIQSLLLMKQTLQYGPKNRTLVLNGPLLKLGTVDDIRNDGAGADDSVEFEWDFSSELDLWRKTPISMRPSWFRSALLFGGNRGGKVEQISGQLSWALGVDEPTLGEQFEQGNSGLDKLYPTLNSGSISCQMEEVESSFFWRYSSRELNQDQQAVDTQIPVLDRQHYDSEIDSASATEMANGRPDVRIGGTYLSHFLPIFAEVDYDLRAHRADLIAESMTKRRMSVLFNRAVDEGFILPAHVTLKLKSWADLHGLSFTFPDGEITVEDLRKEVIRAFEPKNALQDLLPANLIDATLEEFARVLANTLKSDMPEDRDFELEAPKALDASVDIMKAYFTSGIRYLGPLRDEPRPVYPVEALEETTAVGYRGEHTAAVLDLNRRTRVKYMAPNEVVNRTYKESYGTLQEAVNAWSNYMGVAISVATHERGVFGHQLQVETETTNRKFRDLTNVGVGVSQVLPILVMALLAPTGSLLVFEQPELHLHPKVQARLADFFIATALSNRQCILETHSEYLVDRLRRRIAEADGPKIKDLVQIFFVERDGCESNSRQVAVSPFGAFQEWPKDFFDQSQEEAEAILRAASAKPDSDA